MCSSRRNEEEDRAEKAEQLKRSKAELSGALKKLRGKIWPLSTEDERNLTSVASVDLAAKLGSYDEKGKAQVMYDEELARKMELDAAVIISCNVSGWQSVRRAIECLDR